MATENLIIKVDEKGALVVSRNIDGIRKSAQGAEGALQLLKTALGALAAFAGVKEFVQLSSVWTDLQSRIMLATKSSQEQALVTQRLTEAARRAYAPFESMAEIYLRNASSLSELGISTEDQLNFTEAMTNALVVSGAKAERAETVINALSKAMSRGQLSGINWNTVLEQGGRIVDALADGLGTSIRQLRVMAESGELTTSTVFTALMSQMEQLRKEADAMPATIRDSLVVLRNNLMRFIGDVDKRMGISSAVVRGLDLFSKHLADLALAGKALIVMFGLLFSQQILGSAAMMFTTLAASISATSTTMIATSTGAIPKLITSVKALTVSVKTLWAAIVANPLIALGAVAIAGTVAGIDILNRKMSEAEAQQERAHDLALQMSRKRLAVVQKNAAAKTSIDELINALKLENDLITKSQKEREYRLTVMRAEKDAARPLEDAEKRLIQSLIDEKYATEASMKAIEDKKSLIASVYEPMETYRTTIAVLDAELKKANITEEQRNALLRARAEAEQTYASALKMPEAPKAPSYGVDPVRATINALQEENVLLKLNKQERAETAALMQLQNQLTMDQMPMDPARAEEIRTLIQVNEQLALQNQLYEEIAGPSQAYALSIAALNQLLQDGKISQEQFNKKLIELQSTLSSEDLKKSGTGGEVIRDVFDNGTAAINDMDRSWKKFVSGFLSDLGRMAQQALMLNVIKGLGSWGVPGFQTGGQFTVPGVGGPDSQLVAFRATPGEHVRIGTPGQSRDTATMAVPTVATPNVNVKIVNLFDPAELAEMMAGAEGEEVILNTISRNSSSVRRSLG